MQAAEVADKSPRRWSGRRIVLSALLTVAGVVVIWTVVVGLVAAHQLREVRGDVRRLTTAPGSNRTVLEHRLQRDLSRVDSARALLGEPGPVVFGWVPILGRNVRAERVVAEASAGALRSGLTLSRSTKGLSDGHGGVDLGRLRAASAALGAAAKQLEAQLDRLATQPVGWTLPPVSAGMRQARDQLLGLDESLARGATGLGALVDVLGGEGTRTVLVALMNNAELRGSGGLTSAYATGKIDAGHLDLTPFQDVNTVAQPPERARRVPAPAAFHAEYGDFLADTTLWKNVTMSPQGGDSADVLAQLSAVSLHVRPDVVVLCDVPAAAAVISATGPVTINGESVSGDELTRRLLVDAYGNGQLSDDKQNARRRALDSAASQAFERLKHDATSTPALLTALMHAVSGRHVIVWSGRPAEEQLLVSAGVGGQIDADGKDIALAVTNNLGDSPSNGNKLDYYVDRHLSVNVRLHPDFASVVQTLTLHNHTPLGLGPYVTGVVHPGEVRELLSMDAAADATLTGFTLDGAPEDVTRSTADGAQRVTTVMQLPRGATASYRLSYRIPLHGGRYRLLLVPQALARPGQLHLRVSTSDAQMGVVSGIDQPDGGVIDISKDWDSQLDIVIPVHSLRGLRGLLHAIARFWNHKVSL
jgi:hypothetical protein